MEAATLLKVEHVAALEVLQSALGVIAFDDRGSPGIEVEEFVHDVVVVAVLALDLDGGAVEAPG